ncbi:hypothetical protein ACVINW_003537 [Bradyrhizobium sp. USDA 4461]
MLGKEHVNDPLLLRYAKLLGRSRPQNVQFRTRHGAAERIHASLGEKAALPLSKFR